MCIHLFGTPVGYTAPNGKLIMNDEYEKMNLSWSVLSILVFIWRD